MKTNSSKRVAAGFFALQAKLPSIYSDTLGQGLNGSAMNYTRPIDPMQLKYSMGVMTWTPYHFLYTHKDTPWIRDAHEAWMNIWNKHSTGSFDNKVQAQLNWSNMARAAILACQ